ncbi:MAG: hypothetical protein AAEJ52_12260 [Myxococcota bacterium]
MNAHERILNAAEARLLARGPSGLVLDAIAADAGISKGGLLGLPRLDPEIGSETIRTLRDVTRP